MIIDTHVHYGYIFFPIKVRTAEDIVDAMEKFHIDIGIVSNIAGIFYDFRGCNQELYDAISKYPDRLKGYIVINPNYIDESLEDLDRYSKFSQFVGVKLHASWHNKPIDGPEYEVLFKRCEELNLPILIHSYVVDDYSDQVSSPERIANVAKRHTNPIIMAHLGGNYRRACKAVKNVENIYVDISSGRERGSQLYVWELGRISDSVAELGADRVLFGTDFPLLDPAICFGMIEDAGLDEKEREMVMWRNANKLFKIL